MDYQYPAENLDFDEIVEEQLELYKSAQAKYLEELIPDQLELDEMNEMMDEREQKVVFFIISDNPVSYLQKVIDYRMGGENKLYERYFSIASDGITDVNLHVISLLEKEELGIEQAPRTKSELHRLLERIEAGVHDSDLSLDINLKVPRMDLRVSMLEAKLQNGFTNNKRLDFIREINYQQNSFRDRMGRLKEIEKAKRDKEFMKFEEQKKKQNLQHHEEARENLKNSQSRIQVRQMQRLEAESHFKSYLKLQSMTKFTHEKIAESYQRKVLEPKQRQDQKALDQLTKKFKPIDFIKMQDHTRSYDAQKQIQLFKFKQKYGLNDPKPSLENRKEENFQVMIINKQKTPKFQEVKKLHSAQMMYSQEVSKHFLPKIKLRKNVSSSSIMLSNKNRPDEQSPRHYKEKLKAIGDQYLQESIEKIRSSRDPVDGKLRLYKSQELIKEENSEENSRFRVSRNGTVYEKKPKHKNFLIELKTSNLLSKEKEWKTISKNDKLDGAAKYHQLKMGLERQERLLDQKERLVRQKAKENGKKGH